MRKRRRALFFCESAARDVKRSRNNVQSERAAAADARSGFFFFAAEGRSALEDVCSVSVVLRGMY